MPFCRNCGNQIDEGAAVCVKCGCATEKMNENKAAEIPDFIWGILGFFVPIAGLILWILWKDEKPSAAKGAGIGALISTAVSVLFVIIYFVIYFGIIAAVFGGSIFLS